jgi:hypothetical protein
LWAGTGDGSEVEASLLRHAARQRAGKDAAFSVAAPSGERLGRRPGLGRLQVLGRGRRSGGRDRLFGEFVEG